MARYVMVKRISLFFIYLITVGERQRPSVYAAVEFGILKNYGGISKGYILIYTEKRAEIIPLHLTDGILSPKSS